MTIVDFMTDLLETSGSLSGKIAKGTAIFSLSTMILTFIQLLTSILVVRTLSKLDYGRLALALSVHAVGTIFLDLGLSGVVSSEIARSRGADRLDKVKRYVLRYSQMEVLGGFLLLALCTVASFWIGKVYDPSVSRLFIVIGFYLFLSGIKNLFHTIFHSYTLYHYVAFFEIGFASLRFFLVLLLVMALKQGLTGAILTYPLSLAITIIVLAPFWWSVVSPLQTVKASKEPVFRKALREQGLYVALMLPLKRLCDQIPTWMIQGLLGTEMVAVYAAAQKGFSPFYALLNSLEMTLFPLASEKISTGWETTKTMLNRATKYASWSAALLVIGGWLSAPLLYRLLFSERYMEAVPAFRIYLFVLSVYAFMIVQRPLFYALRAQKYLLYAYVVGVCSYALLLYLFISQLGVLGAALALLVNSGIMMLVRSYFLHRIKSDFKINVKNIFRVDEFDKRMFKEKILSRL